MEVYTLYGPANSGKTNVMRNIHQKICSMRGSKLLLYKTAGVDECDFDAVFSIREKTIVIRSYGDCIEYVRTGLNFAKSNMADVLLNVWNKDLDDKYNIKKELPNAEIIKNPVLICEPLRSQLIDFSNLIASKL